VSKRSEDEPTLPTFVHGRPLTQAALAFAARAHGDEQREADRAPFILHPLEVASLLDGFGFDDCVTAAAVLHDTLEDTEATGHEIEERFGPRVAQLVRAQTEYPQIAGAPERKGALRRQVARSELEAAAIFAADKVSKVRELRIRLSHDPDFTQREGGWKLDHYWKSLEMLEQTIGNHPLVGQLRFELEAVRAFPPGGASQVGP
jgi:(p)ppGpp synthase/HD superfamily hydrolase